MSQTWKIRFSDQNPKVIETGIRPYHFFKDSISLVNEQREPYGAVLDFHETSSFFNYLDFTTHDIAEVMEVDPSTLFRWKRKTENSVNRLPKTYWRWIRLSPKASGFLALKPYSPNGYTLQIVHLEIKNPSPFSRILTRFP